MKRLAYLLLLTVLLTSGRPTAHERYLLVPGRSVGPFDIDSTRYSDVRHQFGRGEQKQFKHHGWTCGRVHYHNEVSYLAEGLVFHFPGLQLKRHSPLHHIVIQRPCEAATAEGISLSSSKAEVLDAFGPADTTGADGWLYYGKQGIEVHFVPGTSAADSMVAIHLFAPRP